MGRRMKISEKFKRLPTSFSDYGIFGARHKSCAIFSAPWASIQQAGHDGHPSGIQHFQPLPPTVLT